MDERVVGYIESNLLPDEQIVYLAKLHWIIFLKAFFVAFFVIVIGAYLLTVEPIAGGIAILLGMLILIPPVVRYKTSEFGVTTKRVVFKVGFIRRRTLELLLRHVEAILVDQSVMGRLFNYGSVTITGTGGVREVFHDVSSPLELRRRIQGQAA
ncbi:MAG TPA: PH domain-containing protein [Candidatus Binatia bacterium]